MTDQSIAPKTQETGLVVPYDRIRELVAKTGANPAALEFPTDRWGFTSAIKREVLKAAGTVRGQDDKHDLLVGTLAILIQHIKKRKEGDAAVRRAGAAEQQKHRDDRLPRERVGAAPAAKKD